MKPPEDRPSTVMLPYSSIPRMDLNSPVYHKAVDFVARAAANLVAENRKRARRSSMDAFGDSQYQRAGAPLSRQFSSNVLMSVT